MADMCRLAIHSDDVYDIEITLLSQLKDHTLISRGILD